MNPEIKKVTDKLYEVIKTDYQMILQKSQLYNDIEEHPLSKAVVKILREWFSVVHKEKENQKKYIDSQKKNKYFSKQTTQCNTFSHYDEHSGEKLYKPKKKYKSMELAIDKAKEMNLKKFNHGEKDKVVAYKCEICHKYHIGKNGSTLSDKYINKIKENK